MEDEEWLQRLLKASRNALEYARSREADTHVIAGLEEQCKNLERRLANASGRVSPLTRCDECSPLRDEQFAALERVRSSAIVHRTMKARLERQARNESLLRTVNDQIAALGGRATNWAEPEHQFEFQCECGRENGGCDRRVLMTLEEYERVRSQRDRFAVVPGHETDEIERVVEKADRYVIVDKRDEAEPFVQ